MSKLDEAIEQLESLALTTGRNQYARAYLAVAGALEEIRNHIQPTNSAVQLMQTIGANTVEPEPVTFQPWDVVRPTPEGAVHLASDVDDHRTAWRDMEFLVVSGPDKHDVYKLYSVDHEREYYLERDHLELVSRLKPRTQPILKIGDMVWDKVNCCLVQIVSLQGSQAVLEHADEDRYMQHIGDLELMNDAIKPRTHPVPQFRYGQRVAFKCAPRPAESWKVIVQQGVHVRLNRVPWCADPNDLIVLPDDYDQRNEADRLAHEAAQNAHAEPTFKAGDRVKTGLGLSGTIEFTRDDGKCYVSFADGDNEWIPSNELELVPDGVASFQVGDWVRWDKGDNDSEDGKIINVHNNGWYDVDFNYGHVGHVETIQYSRLTKIEPPTPRFKFGDRVRWTRDRNKRGLYIGKNTRTNVPDTHMIVLEDGTRYDVNSWDLQQLDNNEK